MSTTLSCAFAAGRCWVRVYTWGMPEDARERRRAEIESDVWELAPGTRSAH